MAAGSETVLRYLRRLVLPTEPGEATDAALLGRFVSCKDEQAFTALVDRHGPLVLRVCRRVLGDVHDAEDAFQAAFLILARKAATVHPREALTAWLHGVARRVALKARSARTRPFREPRTAATPLADPRPDPLAELSGRELLLIVDEEVRRLPEAYRLPVILCCLEGRSLEEAARQLGWKLGSVKGRLQRGRARLQARLQRRGLTLSAGLAAAEVSRGAVSAAAVGQLVVRTVRGAVAFRAYQAVAAEGITSGAAALAAETLRAMARTRLKSAAALLVATCLLVTGWAIHRAGPSQPTAPLHDPLSPFPTEDRAARAAPADLAVSRRAAPRDGSDAPVEVSGRVLDPGGKPLAGAELYVGYALRRRASDSQLRPTAYPRRATSGADGRFRFVFARSELDARGLDDWRPAVAAVAAGYGPDWAEIGDPGGGAGLSLRLVEDLAVSGRILDATGQPVAGARLVVRGVTSDSQEGMTRFLQGNANGWYWYPKSWRGPLPGQAPQVTTDADGRFRLTGCGRDRLVALTLEGPSIPPTLLEVATQPSPAIPAGRGIHGATFDYTVPPSRPIRGVVRDQATGQPVAGVKVSADEALCTTLTGADGAYEVLGDGRAQGHLLRAQPAEGQGYLAASKWVPGAPGLNAVTVNFDLVRGIVLRGRVTDQATHKPPPAAVVEYYPLFPNRHSSRITNLPSLAASSAAVQPDGSYALAILPGPGVVCVAASPRNSYAVARVDDQELAGLFNDGANHRGGAVSSPPVGRTARAACP
jgi:RNA polymerase sigma factor (sigma-70 family)